MLAGVVLGEGGNQVLGSVVGVETLVFTLLERKVLCIDHGRSAFHVRERADIDHTGILFLSRLVMQRTMIL